MKFSTNCSIALLATSAAFPVLAQPTPVSGNTTTKQVPANAKAPQVPVSGKARATSTTGRELNISDGARKAIIDLQNAVNANDTAKIPAKLAAARAVAKTSDDKFAIASSQTRAALAANDLGAISAGIDALQASGAGETPDLVALYADLGRRYKQAGQLDAAVVALNKAMALDPNHVATLVNLASVRNAQGQKAEAVALMQKSFAASKASGVKVDEGNYKFATGLAYGQRLPAANDLARQWVAAYPSPSSWRDTLRIYRDLNKPTQSQLIDLMRLGRAASALGGASDYFLFGSALVKAGKLAEAKALLAEAKVQVAEVPAAPDADAIKRAFAEYAASVTDAPTRAAVEAAAKTALAGTDGTTMIDAGDGLYGVGAYAEAVPLYRKALTKTGDAGLANLHLGMALARSGDTAGATAALKAVTGANAEIARYWLLWLATKA